MTVNLHKLANGIPVGRRVYCEMNRTGVAIGEVAVSLRWWPSYRLDSLIDSFWARALQSDVFPVPGGPECVHRHREMNQSNHTWDPTASLTTALKQFTVKKHDAVPGNKVAVDIFIWEVNCCCDIIQKLKKNRNFKKWYDGKITLQPPDPILKHWLFTLPWFSLPFHIQDSPRAHQIQLFKNKAYKTRFRLDWI